MVNDSAITGAHLSGFDPAILSKVGLDFEVLVGNCARRRYLNHFRNLVNDVRLPDLPIGVVLKSRRL